MIKIENVVTPSGEQWMAVIRGMRNPLNSWNLSDSSYVCLSDSNSEFVEYLGDGTDYEECPLSFGLHLGEKDLKLMTNLRNAGTEHRKYLRKIPVYLDIVAPLYWWKEFDTYKVGTVANSCSTMHKIQAKEFTLDDFSTDHLMPKSISTFEKVIDMLNYWRTIYLEGSLEIEPKTKESWWQLIQLLPSSYNQRRTVMLNYEVLANMYHQRRHHKLDEWHTFCDWIESLPYAELITGKKED